MSQDDDPLSILAPTPTNANNGANDTSMNSTADTNSQGNNNASHQLEGTAKQSINIVWFVSYYTLLLLRCADSREDQLGAALPSTTAVSSDERKTSLTPSVGADLSSVGGRLQSNAAFTRNYNNNAAVSVCGFVCMCVCLSVCVVVL